MNEPEPTTIEIPEFQLPCILRIASLYSLNINERVELLKDSLNEYNEQVKTDLMKIYWGYIKTREVLFTQMAPLELEYIVRANNTLNSSTIEWTRLLQAIEQMSRFDMRMLLVAGVLTLFKELKSKSWTPERIAHLRNVFDLENLTNFVEYSKLGAYCKQYKSQGNSQLQLLANMFNRV